MKECLDMRKSLLAVFLLGFSILIQAQQVELKKDHPTTYTVVRGDTLWDISGRFLKKPWLWKQIWQANPAIKNPNLIYPGDVITLTYVNGKPRLSVNRATSRGTIKLSPSVRVQAASDAIPTIPLKSISSFLLNNRIISNANVFTKAPYVIAGQDRSIVSGAGNKIYVKGRLDDAEPSYTIYRQGKEFKDPKTNESLGINANYIGSADVLTKTGEVGTLKLSTTTEEVRVGDRLLPTEERTIEANFLPSNPDTIINGEIISIPRGVTSVGSKDVVIINKGLRDGIKIGNVLAVYRLGETIKDDIGGKDIKLPDEEAGLLMVFRVYDKLSFGIVLSASQMLSVGDTVKNPN